MTKAKRYKIIQEDYQSKTTIADTFTGHVFDIPTDELKNYKEVE